jgi:hypothetical protein
MLRIVEADLADSRNQPTQPEAGGVLFREKRL